MVKYTSAADAPGIARRNPSISGLASRIFSAGRSALALVSNPGSAAQSVVKASLGGNSAVVSVALLPSSTGTPGDDVRLPGDERHARQHVAIGHQECPAQRHAAGRLPISVEDLLRGQPAQAGDVAALQPRRLEQAHGTRLRGVGGVVLVEKPLCKIALWNRPAALGIAMTVDTLPPPPDWPKIVTLPGSPPNAAMLSRTQRSAATRSSMPGLAVVSPAGTVSPK